MGFFDCYFSGQVLMKRKIICDLRWEIPGMSQGFQALFSFLWVFFFLRLHYLVIYVCIYLFSGRGGARIP